jgi:hypothetical protein
MIKKNIMNLIQLILHLLQNVRRNQILNKMILLKNNTLTQLFILIVLYGNQKDNKLKHLLLILVGQFIPILLLQN